MTRARASSVGNIRRFAAVVRSPAAVRHAFAGQRLLACWWACVLALHGRRTAPELSPQQWCGCVADGFRFYGWLYRGLAGAMAVLAVLAAGGFVGDRFWLAVFAASALYLWSTAGLAFAGARELVASAGRRIWPLVAFLFFVAVFLVGLTAAIGMQLRADGRLPDPLVLLLSAAILLLGAGSYLVELAALVAGRSGARERRRRARAR